MARGGVIFNPDVQSDIDMKSTWKLVNYPGSILPSIPVSQTVFVDVNGDDTTAAVGDLYHPAKTISKAITLASSLTPTSSSPVAIVVGPGTFDGGISVPDNVALIGCGAGKTIIQSATASIQIVQLGSYTMLGYLSVVGTLSDGVHYQYPICAASTSVTGVRIYDVATSGDTDGLYWNASASTGVSVKCFNCDFQGKFDAINVFGGEGQFYNCRTEVIGPNSVFGRLANGLTCAVTGVIRWYGGSISVDGASAGVSGANTGILVANSGTIEVHNVRLHRGTTADNNYDFQIANATSTLLYDNVTRDDGAALVVHNNSGTITNLSRYVTKDNNLSEVANVTPTWTGQHIWKFDGLAATQDDSKGLLFENTTAATNGTQQQISPAIRWRGFGWHTVGPSSQSIDFRQYVIPITGTGAARAYLTFEASLDGGAYSNLLALFLSGGMSLGSTTDPGYGKFNALNGIYVNGSPVLTTTGLKLVHESNATADTDTFFYSTDSSGLAYKDAFNVIHPITGAGTSATIQSTLLPLKGDNTGNAIAATVTGTGNVVLDTSPTLATPTIGVATATSVNKWTLTAPSTSATLTAGADNLTYTMPEISTKVGFRHIPQNSQSAPYTTVLTDSGKHIYHPAADANDRTITIDSNANVAYPIGTAIMFVNLSANNLSIAITADTMYLAGTGTTGTRTLAQYGKATAIKTGTTEWVVSGVGLS